MATELKMPALSPTMEKGNLARWLVSVGDSIKAGDMIAEIETDKATMEFEAADDGRIAELVIPAGTEDVAVGTVIARLASEDEGIAVPVAAKAELVTETAVAAPAVREPEVVVKTPASVPQTSAPIQAGAPLELDANAKATPLARRIAAAKGISLAGITASGPRGKIVKSDLGIPSLIRPIAAPPAAAPITVPAASAIAPPPAGVPVETVRLTGMRKTIARRLSESKQTVPHFYLTARCNLDPLFKLRGELNAGLEHRGIKLSVNDMLIKAMALALIEVPDANVQFAGDELHRFGRADIAMAVAIDGGLVTPVIKGADTLSLSGIATTAKALASKAREGKLTPEDYQGGTASISNLGMFGIDEMFPVINPPQALILGIGAGIEQPWQVDGAIGLATIMAATGSFDHRAIDGAVAAQFMAAFRELLEVPLRIVG
ncbi:dihydrolipoamide acetyltransferase family protein [Novosphingobium pentaromativorans]|uniref:Dihydrolipoamide acetyltransferase component of pyruvate dehydrogenase complex n=1 Tax=Novosphingobium pentaromativorans US6-1 TaxID=1088721 RepID=G6EGB2_9SPHN|nr:dihydrolipoamide acetyltransferase family protein [Novosphingobium pentaromativorans]AIT82203.1 branched-chain alpha-keto acid dehydrogenase subunit E2 [Novosphingobium pentaromativorans US6-1]EHJ59801.1 Dihydrolipoyllysine-residue acetyltransferase [Novosphingobium pentaromativorans US6-1]